MCLEIDYESDKEFNFEETSLPIEFDQEVDRENLFPFRETH